MFQRRDFWRAAATLSGLAGICIGATIGAPPSKAPSPAQTAAFEKSVRPVLLARCISCHSSDSKMGGVRLDQAIDAATATKLASAVTHTGKSKMPPSGPIPAAEQKALRDWVAAGASWPAGSKMASSRDINSQIKSHWAFQPIRLPALPRVKDTAWAKNPIDRFTLAKMEAAGIKPSKPAR